MNKMKKYEYKVLQETDTYAFSIENINYLGEQGWRVITWLIADNGYETVLLEREIPNGTHSKTKRGNTK